MAKGLLTFAKVSRVRNGVAFALGEKGRESHVKADGRMLTDAWKMLGVRLYKSGAGRPAPKRRAE